MKNNVLLGVVLIVGLLWGENTFAQEKKAPKVPTEMNIGGMLYGKFCSSCHGIDLKGSKTGPSFIHRVYHPGHHSDGSFFLAAKNGARQHHWQFGNMPPVKGVNEKIVGSIVKYIRHVQKSAGLF
jgi:mono/diheme cytochrome c family protein